ncbi:hypothetical protein, partial [Candidatus Contendibacter odensensis]|uniref:hypothetical protein n=1 Tax=Candidatus Contendibacter odensensis TaxID=1400860 RepID=UPI001E4C75CF
GLVEARNHSWIICPWLMQRLKNDTMDTRHTHTLIPFPDRFCIFQVKNSLVRHTRESGYPVFQRLTGFPHSRE